MRIALAQIRAAPTRRPTWRPCGSTSDARMPTARDWFFPEGAVCRFGVPLRKIAEPTDGAVGRRVRQIASRRHGVTVVAGMFVPPTTQVSHAHRHGAGRGRPRTTRSTPSDVRPSPSRGPSHPDVNQVLIDVDGVAVSRPPAMTFRFSRALHRAGSARREVFNVSILGQRSGQARAVDAAGGAPGRGHAPASSPPSGRPTATGRSPGSGPPASAAVCSPRRSARCSTVRRRMSSCSSAISYHGRRDRAGHAGRPA